MKKHLMYWMAAVILFIIGCQKELSFEGSGTPAKGSLQFDVTGDCLPKTVNGIYSAGAALVPATNTITVQVNVTQTGTYVVTTDTVNGYFFRATGTFTALGMTTVTLRGNGTPFAAGTDNFVVSYDGTICDIAVTVVPAGTGSAVYTANCAGATVNGTYTSGTALTASNTITIPITLTTPGTYTLTGTINGMTFSSSGALAAGTTSITLNGSGTPGTSGIFNLTVGSCTIPITVNAGAGVAVYTLNCAGATVNGTYAAGTVLTASNTITIPITLTTPGTYTITTAPAVNGMIFSNSGTLPAGTTTITLNGSGTPTAAGTFNFTAGSCTIPVTVTGGAAAVYTLNCAGATVNGTYTAGVALTASNTITIPITLTTPGTYSITTAPAVNGMIFSNSGTLPAGTTTITLNGSGTPTASGTFNFTAGSCTIPVPCNPAPSNDYFPRTTNSNWSYEWNDDATDSLYRNVIAATLSAAGNTYNIFMQNDGITPPPDSSGYYRKNGGDYFERFDYGTFIGYDNPGWAEYIMLKDNVAAGTNWKSVGFAGLAGGNPFNIRFSYTILNPLNGSLSVTTSTGTVNYTNVIVVEEKYELETSPGNWTQISTGASGVGFGKSYYARGIGLILYEAFDNNSVKTDWMELRRYVVF